jgi:hypothetical protein
MKRRENAFGACPGPLTLSGVPSQLLKFHTHYYLVLTKKKAEHAESVPKQGESHPLSAQLMFISAIDPLMVSEFLRVIWARDGADAEKADPRDR